MKCMACGKEMLHHETRSCSIPFVRVAGKVYQRNTEYYDVNERCHDCYIVNGKGNVHHVGCDMERCPKCDGQLISCACDDAPEFGVMTDDVDGGFLVL